MQGYWPRGFGLFSCGYSLITGLKSSWPVAADISQSLDCLTKQGSSAWLNTNRFITRCTCPARLTFAFLPPNSYPGRNPVLISKLTSPTSLQFRCFAQLQALINSGFSLLASMPGRLRSKSAKKKEAVKFYTEASLKRQPCP